MSYEYTYRVLRYNSIEGSKTPYRYTLSLLRISPLVNVRRIIIWDNAASIDGADRVALAQNAEAVFQAFNKPILCAKTFDTVEPPLYEGKE